jgi:hypothetical protein
MNLLSGLLEEVAKSRSSSFDQSKPFDAGNADLSAASNKDKAHHGQPKLLQPQSPDLIPERGKSWS